MSQITGSGIPMMYCAVLMSLSRALRHGKYNTFNFAPLEVYQKDLWHNCSSQCPQEKQETEMFLIMCAHLFFLVHPPCLLNFCLYLAPFTFLGVGLLTAP